MVKYRAKWVILKTDADGQPAYNEFTPWPIKQDVSMDFDTKEELDSFIRMGMIYGLHFARVEIGYKTVEAETHLRPLL